MDTVHVRRFFLASVLAGAVVVPSVMAAPPVCGRKACREEIQACIDSQCEGLHGKAHARCKKACVAAVMDACDADPSVCNGQVTTTTVEVTTTSTVATTSSTSTTLAGSPSGAFE
jgi:hypothetical protein